MSGQLSQVGHDPRWPGNLFEPPAGDAGAHGPYDDRAHGRSVQLWATKHRRSLLGGLGAAAAAAGMVAARRLA